MTGYNRENKPSCPVGEHDWEAGYGWGVIIGVSQCRRCGVVCRSEDFAYTAPNFESAREALEDRRQKPLAHGRDWIKA